MRRPSKQQQLDAEIRMKATLVVGRVLEVYRPEYIARRVATEPSSLLALVKSLESALLRRMG